jgi:uncharacterized FlaG/YvyC family protein
MSSQCTSSLCTEGIKSRKDFLNWTRKNHPDKCEPQNKEQCTIKFQDISNCISDVRTSCNSDQWGVDCATKSFSCGAPQRQQEMPKSYDYIAKFVNEQSPRVHQSSKDQLNKLNSEILEMLNREKDLPTNYYLLLWNLKEEINQRIAHIEETKEAQKQYEEEHQRQYEREREEKRAAVEFLADFMNDLNRRKKYASKQELDAMVAKIYDVFRNKVMPINFRSILEELQRKIRAIEKSEKESPSESKKSTHKSPKRSPKKSPKKFSPKKQRPMSRVSPKKSKCKLTSVACGKSCISPKRKCHK